MTMLQGKTAIVTGASAGIGAATVRQLAGAGANVIMVARRADRLNAMAQTPGCVPYPADLADPAAMTSLRDFAIERFGAIDLVVNNAGVLYTGTLDQFDPAQFQQTIAVNYEAVVRGTQIFADTMKQAGRGHIINVSSIGASIVAPGTGIYSGLKRALEIFTDSLRIELVGTGVRLGYIAPGTTSTEIFEPMKARGEDSWDSYMGAPLEPDDVAEAILFMATRPERANIAKLSVYAAEERF